MYLLKGKGNRHKGVRMRRMVKRIKTYGLQREKRLIYMNHWEHRTTYLLRERKVHTKVSRYNRGPGAQNNARSTEEGETIMVHAMHDSSGNVRSEKEGEVERVRM